jgi:hypothetical protein
MDLVRYWVISPICTRPWNHCFLNHSQWNRKYFQRRRYPLCTTKTDVGLSVHFIETRVFISQNQTTLMVGEMRFILPIRFTHNFPTTTKKKKYSACFAVPSSCSMALWHQRLAHTSYRIVSKMANNEEVYELNLPNNKATPNHHCLVCLSGKMHRLPFPIRRTRANQIGQLIHADVCGPMHYPHQVEHATSYFSRTNSLDGAMFVS